MAIVLGLDTNSHTTGYSVFKNNKLKGYGTIKVPKRFITPRRLFHFYNRLRMLVDETGPDVIVVEDLQHMRNKNSVNTLAAFLGVTRMISYMYLGQDAILIPPTKIKMAATGKGRAEKIEVIHAANNRFKLQLEDTDDDIADAIYAAYAYIQGE